MSSGAGGLGVGVGADELGGELGAGELGVELGGELVNDSGGELRRERRAGRIAAPIAPMI